MKENKTAAPLDEKALEARRAYHREWRKANKERVREYNHRFWQKKAEERAKRASN